MDDSGPRRAVVRNFVACRRSRISPAQLRQTDIGASAHLPVVSAAYHDGSDKMTGAAPSARHFSSGLPAAFYRRIENSHAQAEPRLITS